MNKDQIEGKVEAGNGKVKEAAGQLSGDEVTQKQDVAQKNVGKVRSSFADLKEDMQQDQ